MWGWEAAGCNTLISATRQTESTAAARTALEEALAAIWESVLQLASPVGVDDHFLELGGDSTQAVAMFAEVKRVLGRELPVGMLIGAPTVARLAEAMSRETGSGDSMPQRCVVPIQPRGGRAPLFC